MLGKNAGGLFWLFRYLERSENIARLVDVGFRLSLTRLEDDQGDWESILETTFSKEAYFETHERIDTNAAINFLLREKSNPSSVISVINAARDNARMVRTALTQEVWEAVNDGWMHIKDMLARSVRTADLLDTLVKIRQQSALVRAALQATMLRNDIYDFCRIGTYLERADNTARILDVKYYVLLPSVSHVGSVLDNTQWETILQSASAARSYRWLNGGDVSARSITEFLILDKHLPRSLAFCCSKMSSNLEYLVEHYGERTPSADLAQGYKARLRALSIDDIFENGLHEFIQGFIQDVNTLGLQIEKDYRFYT